MSLKPIDIKTIDKNAFTLIGEEWMLVTAGNEEKCNTMTASWGGVGVLWNKNVATIYIRPTRYTKTFIDENECFTLSFFDESYKKGLGICGSVSGRDTDKFAQSGFHAGYLDTVPYIEEANMVFVCRKLYQDEIKPTNFLDASLDSNYPLKDYHTMYIAEITQVLARDLFVIA